MENLNHPRIDAGQPLTANDFEHFETRRSGAGPAQSQRPADGTGVVLAFVAGLAIWLLLAILGAAA